MEQRRENLSDKAKPHRIAATGLCEAVPLGYSTQGANLFRGGRRLVTAGRPSNTQKISRVGGGDPSPHACRMNSRSLVPLRRRPGMLSSVGGAALLIIGGGIVAGGIGLVVAVVMKVVL